MKLTDNMMQNIQLIILSILFILSLIACIISGAIVYALVFMATIIVFCAVVATIYIVYKEKYKNG